MSIIAAGWAILAAYCKRIDNWRGDTLNDVLMLPRDIICAFPWLALLLLLMSMTLDHGTILVALIVGLVMLPHAAGMMQKAYNSQPKGITWLQSVFRSIPVVFVFAAAGIMFYVSALGYSGFGTGPDVMELGSMANTGSALAGNRAASGFVGNTDYRRDDRRRSCRKARFPLRGILVEDYGIRT
jgi:ABC-type dipeptide/oligopeptide/nickel transport system permease subunit